MRFGRSKPAKGEYRNQPRQAPTHEGAEGRAWKLQSYTIEAPEQAAILDSYLVNTPGSHPVWPWYLVSVIHLRSVPGESAPPMRKSEDMTHEFLVVAMNPEKPLPSIRRWRKASWLSPPDQVVQFAVPSDDDGRGVLDAAVRAMVDGANPDQDYRSWWERSITATAEHYRMGLH